MSHPTTCKLQLSQKESVADLYRKYGHSDSAHSFESMFMWKDDMDLELYTQPDLYSARCMSEPFNWFFPVGEKNAKIKFIEELAKEPSLSLSYMTKEDKTFLEEHFPRLFDITEEPSESEYIFDRDTIENLPGSSFSKSRGYIRRLIASYEIETVSLEDIDIRDVITINNIWSSHKQEYTGAIDGNATLNSINHMSDLGLTGIVLIMEGSPCAVCAGFPLNEHTMDCCIQKATQGMQGLNYYLRQEYAKSQPASITTFNWEEDLGIEGLRQAKTLMHPSDMITMYTGKKI